MSDNETSDASHCSQAGGTPPVADEADAPRTAIATKCAECDGWGKVGRQSGCYWILVRCRECNGTGVAKQTQSS